jgi:hypothetical protein
MRIDVDIVIGPYGMAQGSPRDLSKRTVEKPKTALQTIAKADVFASFLEEAGRSYSD